MAHHSMGNKIPSTQAVNQSNLKSSAHSLTKFRLVDAGFGLRLLKLVFQAWLADRQQAGSTARTKKVPFTAQGAQISGS